MKKTIHNFLLFSLFMFIGVLVVACATKSYINVNYRPLLSSYDFKGKFFIIQLAKLSQLANSMFCVKEKALTFFYSDSYTEKTEPVIEIDLKKFFLDLVDRKWVAEISYEARLIKNNKLLATETISGNAERFKMFPQSDAEKVLGEIFTDVVNKLDFGKLFQQAEL